MTAKVLGIGNALVDALVQVENDEILKALELPKGSMQLIDAKRYMEISKKLVGCDVKRSTGGSACNTILALAHMNAHPGMIGKVSDDDNGRFFADNCLESGISAHLLTDPLPTGVATTFITPDGQRTFATYLGAAAQMEANDLKMEWLDGYDYMYIEGYLVQNHNLMNRAMEYARAAGLKVCLDLASYNIVEAEHAFFSHLLDRTDIVFANEEEARAFTGKAPEEALDELARRCKVAVVKTGKDGSIAQQGNERAKVNAKPVAKVVDTTAAGDFFAAGFLYGHAQGFTLEKCLETGSLLAAEVIQVVGTQIPDSRWKLLVP